MSHLTRAPTRGVQRKSAWALLILPLVAIGIGLMLFMAVGYVGSNSADAKTVVGPTVAGITDVAPDGALIPVVDDGIALTSAPVAEEAISTAHATSPWMLLAIIGAIMFGLVTLRSSRLDRRHELITATANLAAQSSVTSRSSPIRKDSGHTLVRATRNTADDVKVHTAQAKGLGLHTVLNALRRGRHPHARD